MMNVMIFCCISTHHLQRVQGKPVTTMVVDGFKGCKYEKDGRLPDRQTCNSFGDGCSQGVDQQSFNRVIVESAESVRDVEAVMDGMEVFVKEFAGMHSTVNEVLPCIHDKAE